MENFSLALVTGATSGIGEELCRLLADKGINLIITGRNNDKLKQLVDELSDQVAVTPFSADLRFMEDRALLVEKIHRFVPDLVINNAGYGIYGHTLAHETSESIDLLEVNAAAVAELTIEAARTLASHKRKGVILNISSVASFFPFPNLAMYAASKAFVTSFSESFDGEMEPFGIRILTACPGQVDTSFTERAGGTKSAFERKRSMTAEYAAKQIWDQIDNEKPVKIFNNAYWIMSWFNRLIPRSLLKRILKKHIASRLPSNQVLILRANADAMHDLD